jgi:RNA polymerase sigma-70 factor (ECF subfamily)
MSEHPPEGRLDRSAAVAMYVRCPGASTYEAFSQDILRIDDGLIAEIITFDSEVFDWFSLPRQLQAG